VILDERQVIGQYRTRPDELGHRPRPGRVPALQRGVRVESCGGHRRPRRRIRKLGFEPAFMSASDFGKFIASDDASIAKLMGQLGLKKQ
jgi:hypothetical protein